MSGIDGALADEYTQGINAPANGQQGYFAFADQQTPRPNLEYKSTTETATQLKMLIGQAADARTANGATIAANGSINFTFAYPNTPHSMHEFFLRCIVRVGSTQQFAARTRLVIMTGATGLIVSSNASAEFSLGSGFSLVHSAGVSTSVVGLTVNSTTGSVANVMASITQTYFGSIV